MRVSSGLHGYGGHALLLWGLQDRRPQINEYYQAVRNLVAKVSDPLWLEPFAERKVGFPELGKHARVSS